MKNPTIEAKKQAKEFVLAKYPRATAKLIPNGAQIIDASTGDVLATILVESMDIPRSDPVAFAWKVASQTMQHHVAPCRTHAENLIEETSMPHQEMTAPLQEIDIHDLLKQRVMDGHPIVQFKPANLDAKTSATLDKVMYAEITRLKEETGLPVKVIQVVQMPVLK